MTRRIYLLLPFVLASVFVASCELLTPDNCKEGQTRITINTADNTICCPEGCTCLSEADSDTRNSADKSTLPPNDTISIPEPPPSGDPIGLEECANLDDTNAYTLDPGNDASIIMTLHDANYEELKLSGQNLLSGDNYFTRGYLNNGKTPYFITIVRSQTNGKIIRFAYSSETLFATRISLN
ncbi:MAG: hypothetical protein R3C61_14150 [Bacteroidia bacterium]